MKIRSLLLAGLIALQSGCYFKVIGPTEDPHNMTVSGEMTSEPHEEDVYKYRFDIAPLYPDVVEDDLEEFDAPVYDVDVRPPRPDVKEDIFDINDAEHWHPDTVEDVVPDIINKDIPAETIEDIIQDTFIPDIQPDEVEVVCPYFAFPDNPFPWVNEGGTYDHQVVIIGDLEAKVQIIDPPAGANFNDDTNYLSFSPDYEFVQHPLTQKLAKFKFSYNTEDCGATMDFKLAVDDVNRPPELTPGPLETNQGSPLCFDYPVQDPDGDPVYVSSLGDPGHGAIMPCLGSPMPAKYIPILWYCGPDQFSLTFNDAYGGETTDIKEIDVKCP